MTATYLLPADEAASPVCKAFDQLTLDGAQYCVMGRTDSLPGSPVGDIDIVLAQKDFARHRALTRSVADRVGGRVVQCLQHERSAFYYVIALPPDCGTRAYMTLDLCSDYVRQRRLFIHADDLLRDRSLARSEGGRLKCFFVAASHMEFIYYLLKKIDKRSLSNAHAQHLSDVYERAPLLADEWLGRYFLTESRKAIANAAVTGKWHWIQEHLDDLRAELRRRARPTQKWTWAYDIKRFGSRVVQPTGFQLVLLGPDGSGKSKVASLLIPQITQMFRRVKEYHLSPRTPKTSHSAVVVSPHSAAPRRMILSIIQTVWWCFVYTTKWLTSLYPAKVRSTLIVFDRYYHDILVDPRRYRYGGPRWWVRLLGRLIPKPDLWVVLDAPAGVLQARKQEVTFEESARQRQLYSDLAGELMNCIVVDAAQHVDGVVNEVVDAVIAMMADRMRARG